MSTTTEETVREENEQEAAEREREFEDAAPPNAETGQLFEVPRAKIEIDETDPDRLYLNFSGRIELERGIASDVALFNSLKPGKNADLLVQVFVSGGGPTHRRDSEGEVDAVVATKKLVVHSVEIEA